MKTVINRIALGVIILVVVLWEVDKASLGYWYIGIIPLICLILVNYYISKLEKKDEIDKKVNIIGWICFFATGIIGLVLILSFPEIFNTYGFRTSDNGF